MKVIKPLAVTESGFIERESNAYYRDENGLLAVAGPNVTRFLYDAEGNFDGFLIEPDAHQSVLKHSEVFSNAAFWQKQNITIGAAGVGPDGEATSATRLTATGTATLRYSEIGIADTSFTFASIAQAGLAQFELLPVSEAAPNPVVQAVGTAVSGTSGSANAAWPAHETGDIAILLFESSSGIAIEPSGWTYIANPGLSGGTNTTGLKAYWRRATSNAMGTVAVSAAGLDHFYALIITVRGCVAAGSPIGTVVELVDAASTATKTIPGFLSSVNHSLVMVVASHGNDVSTLATSGWASPSLTDFAVHVNGTGTTLGNGGGLVAASGNFQTTGYLAGLTESKFRSSIFAKRISGTEPVKLYNTRGADEALLDLSAGEVISGDADIQAYASGWYRISATKDTGFIASEYGFGLEFEGELLVMGANLIPGLADIQYLLNDAPMTGDIVLEVEAANLIYSNIPLPDPDYEPEATATIWAAVAYALNARVIFNGSLYVSKIAGNEDQPDVGAAKEVPSWVVAGKANRWKMYDFERGIDTKSERENLIDFLVQVPGVARSFALLGLEASSVRVEAFLDDEKLFDQEYNLVNEANITDWYDYFSITPTRTATLVRFDLPPVPGLLLRVRIMQDGMVRVGKFLIGSEVALGCARWGFSSPFINTSRQVRDDFGNLILVKRRVYKHREFTLKFDTALAEYIEETVQDIIAEPTYFLGSEKLPTSGLFAIINEFTTVIPGPKQSTASLRLEEI